MLPFKTTRRLIAHCVPQDLFGVLVQDEYHASVKNADKPVTGPKSRVLAFQRVGREHIKRVEVEIIKSVLMVDFFP